MKKYHLPAILIIIGVFLVIMAATGGIAGNATITWILAALFIGFGCWLLWPAIKDSKPNRNEPEPADSKPVAPDMDGLESQASTPEESETASMPDNSDAVSATPETNMPYSDELAEDLVESEAVGNEIEPVRPEVIEPASVTYAPITIRLSGVTQNNPDGESRQELIMKIANQEPPFESKNALDVTLVPSIQEGEQAIECRVNGYLIGLVPKKDLSKIRKAMDQKGMTVSSLNVVGDDDNERLTHGVEIAVRYNNT
jgi:hypothetical protein